MVFTPFWCKSYTILVLWVGDGLKYHIGDEISSEITSDKLRKIRRPEKRTSIKVVFVFWLFT